MASSQSLIHKPEAPTAAFDLGIFSKVLLYKQSKFDQGADQIQAKINQLENTQVLGDAQKKYLSEKVNGVIEGVNGMGGMDFSERNVLNQTSTYIDGITKDPIITSAITNTRNIQKGMSYFEKLRTDAAAGKKGVYYNPANEYDYMESVNDYLRNSKTDAAAVYKERPIAPPVDVNKQVMAAAKEVVASTYTEQDGTNKYILKNGKVVTPDRLYQTVLDQIQTDPTLANQIRINAKYNYLQKDANGELNPNQLIGLRNTYLQANDNRIKSLQNELVELGKLHMTTGDKDAQVRIQSQIDETARELTRYQANQDSRTSEIDTLLATNPEQAAATVYSNKLIEGVVAAKAYREEKVQFNQAAMFVDKLNFQQDQERFDQEMAEKQYALEVSKLALAAEKQASDAAIAAGKAAGTDAGIYSNEVSLPTNARKSSQETQVDQIRGVQMQQANVQQDYYHYLYQFKNADGIIEKDGNTYRPTDKYKTIFQDNMKKLQDMRDGKKLPAPLDPEFIKIANKYQDLELVKKQYEAVVIDVNREALKIKKKELGLSDQEYELFLRGKALNDQLPDRDIQSLQQDQVFRAPTFGNKKDFRTFQATPENIKALDTYKKYQSKLQPNAKDVEKLYEAKGSQIIPRSYTPIGLKESDLKARAGALKGQIQGRGYFSLDGSNKPEQTAGKDIPQDQITYISDSYLDLGNGLKPYVKAEISNGLNGEKKQVSTVYVDVDETYISNFRNFGQNVNEAARQHVLREGKLMYNSASSDGRNVIGTKIVKNGRDMGDESATVQVFVTHDAQGHRITPQALDINITKNMNISQAVEFSKGFADDYSKFYKNALKLNKKPSVASYIKFLNNQSN